MKKSIDYPRWIKRGQRQILQPYRGARQRFDFPNEPINSTALGSGLESASDWSHFHMLESAQEHPAPDRTMDPWYTARGLSPSLPTVRTGGWEAQYL